MFALTINLQSSLRNFVTKIIISCLKLKLHLRYGYLETPISIQNHWLQLLKGVYKSYISWNQKGNSGLYAIT